MKVFMQEDTKDDSKLSDVEKLDKAMEECGCHCHKEPGTLHCVPCCVNDSMLISTYDERKKGIFSFLKNFKKGDNE